MLDAATVRREKLYFSKSIGDLYPQKLPLINKVIELAATEDVTLSAQHEACRNAFLKYIKDARINFHNQDEVERLASIVWHNIKIIANKEDTRAKTIYATNSTFEDKRTKLHQLRTANDVWLNETHIESAMPKDTNSFITLSGVRSDSLREHIQIAQYLNNPNVKTIIMPVGPIHWRLVHIEKDNEDGACANLTIRVFDSFGKASAKSIVPSVEAWIRTQIDLTKTNYAIETYGPQKTQNNGYECGDFVIAESHKIAKEHHADFKQSFVYALERGRSIRAVTIQESRSSNYNVGLENPEDVSKWSKVRKQIRSSDSQYSQLLEKGRQAANKSPEKSVDYTAKDNKIIKVDIATQIQLDEMLARELQEEEDDPHKKFKP